MNTGKIVKMQIHPTNTSVKIYAKTISTVFD